MLARHSFHESTARQRIAALLDAGTLRELLPPEQKAVSPHLGQLDLPIAFDDGVIVGEGELDGRRVLIAAQEGGFMGGAVGEVHGAKITGLLERAQSVKPAAVLLLLESGGVRLHEANAGLIAVSEIMRALLETRAAGVPVLALIGGVYGCFGGMGIVARCCDAIIMSEEGRLGMSGPEVIETAGGVEEFDSRDRALVWRTVGGKHRYLTGDCDRLVADDIAAFRGASLELLDDVPRFDLELVADEHERLTTRLRDFGECRDAREIWSKLGINEADVPLLDAAALVAQVENKRVSR